MEKSISEIQEECIRWYMDQGNDREGAETIVSNDPERIRWTYSHMLKAKEDAKHIGIREVNVAGLALKETYLIDE